MYGKTSLFCDECGRCLRDDEIERRENDGMEICAKHRIVLEDVGPEPDEEDEPSDEEGDSEPDEE